MSTEENKALARRYIEEVFNQKNLALVDEMNPPDFVHHNDATTTQGREPYKQFLSMFFYLTDDQRRAEEVLGGLLSPIMGRPVEVLRERVLVGSANECVEKLAKLQAAGVHKVFLWPVADNAVQLTKFHEKVLPQLPQ